MKYREYAKGILAVAGAVVTSVSTAAAGASTAQVIGTAVGAGLTALLVILVPNRSPLPRTPAGEVMGTREYWEGQGLKPPSPPAPPA